jgi:hypothetical protein
VAKKKSKTVYPRIKEQKPKYYTVGVRFLTANVHKVYTYRVDRKHKVTVGQLLVADTPSGAAVVAAVRIDSTPQDTGFGVEYKYITKKVSDL